ncbi:DUF411 domain-containing protein [Natronospira bacteriovora]|uniref:DUF411 domain-containing protein n=1 Tax=Natronospira bacteriovora TaxID=3069753 RepID=A0ABU0W4M8_9GAMM|nr:DUF411 domain-containing protein [Natronospira sp. AB-CW4]MDQ2068981.1 DUF411 domain-containing protein [Natronospira sp. AB-CW4]
MTARNYLPALLLALPLLLIGLAACSDANEGADGLPEMVVYKTETCGCCEVWVDHVKDAGFAVTAHDISHRELNEKKREAGLDFGLASCHTAFIDGYAIEGHVPAEQIIRLLEERPDVAGLTVPGMPIGSPGMEHGDRYDPYDVLAFQPDGSTTVFASYHRD